jgi:hypothetical protein
MRLVTYDRGGVRRLGALVGQRGAVIDLGDAVGHPAFPTTLEALVAGSGGTALDAARDIVERPETSEELALIRPVVVAPLASAGTRSPIIGPTDRPPWPPFQAYLDHSPEVGAVVGVGGRDLSPRQARQAIFGYVLVVRWLPTSGRRSTIALSLGPWVATPDDLDLRRGGIRSIVGGVLCAAAPLDPARWVFPDVISERSKAPGGIRAGALVTSTLGRSTAGLGIPLEPGSSVEVESDGLGAVRTTLPTNAEAGVERPAI